MNAEQMEEIKRHFGVVAEALKSDIRQIAEGHATIRHELQEHRADLSVLKARMDRLETSRA